MNDPSAEEALARVKDLIRGVRTVRTDMDVPPSRKAKLYVTSDREDVRQIYEGLVSVFAGLASATEVDVQAGKEGISDDAVSFVIPDAVCYILLEELVDLAKEKERLTKEKERLEGELKRSRGMLSNPNFVNKAPEAKVNEEKEKLAKYEQMMAEVVARLEQM